MTTRLIIDQIDPHNLVPGGTDTCIGDLFKYAKEGELALVGITAEEDPLGIWCETKLAGRTVKFLPVARFDRLRSDKSKARIPDSVKLILGVLRYRKQLPAIDLQAHRVETGFVLSFLRRTRLVQFIHNDSAGLTGANSDSMWRRFPKLYKRLEKRVLRKADVVVLFNRTDSERIRTQFPSLTVAQTWFDPELFNTVGDGARPQGLVIAVVGRLEAQKDPLLAVEVLKHVLDRTNSASMVFVGGGSLRAPLLSRARELGVEPHIRLAGPMSRPEVADQMRSSSVLLLTSHYEGSPRVLVEAGATGLPVVATVGADPDRSLDGVTNGIRVSGRDPIQLALAVLAASAFDPVGCTRSVESRAAPLAVAQLLAL